MKLWGKLKYNKVYIKYLIFKKNKKIKKSNCKIRRNGKNTGK